MSNRLERETERLPQFETALQRADPPDPEAMQFQRQTGAGGFVRSGTVEDDIPVAGDLPVPGLEFFG